MIQDRGLIRSRFNPLVNCPLPLLAKCTLNRRVHTLVVPKVPWVALAASVVPIPIPTHGRPFGGPVGDELFDNHLARLKEGGH